MDISQIKQSFKKWFDITSKMFSYNMKIIFANKFIWFLLASVGFFIFLVVWNLFTDVTFTIDVVYKMLLFPGVLLVFYPTCFGIQNDIDAQMLEILFGIPNYRYKVWLVRIAMIYVVTFIVLILLTFISSWLLVDFSPFRMVYHLMFPIFFLGCLGFGLSTLVKSGNGTAVVMVIIGFVFFILSEPLEGSKWNIFLNPFAMPSDVQEVIWRETVIYNRIILSVGVILTVLLGLFRLQKREKFM